MNSRRQLRITGNGLIPGKASGRGVMNLANPTQPPGVNSRGKGCVEIQPNELGQPHRSQRLLSEQVAQGQSSQHGLLLAIELSAQNYAILDGANSNDQFQHAAQLVQVGCVRAPPLKAAVGARPLKEEGMAFQNDATMKEKADVLRNDLRNQGSTFAQFAQSEANEAKGRFSSISNPTVVGESSIPKYPAAFHQHDPVPDEPKLGIDVNAMEPCGEKFEVERSLGPSLPSAKATPPAPQQAPPLAQRAGGFSSRTYRRK